MRDQTLGLTAKEAARIGETACSRHENLVAGLQARLPASLDDIADGFVSRDQGITHAGERGHGAGPEQPFGPAADAAPGNIDEDIGLFGAGEFNGA